MENPFVSVIMSVHNGNIQEISQSIESIFNQTYPEKELIVCDDGSNEDIALFLERLSKRKHFLLIRNSVCLGLPASLNRCLTMARGKYIARMDSDDISLPNRLLHEMKLFALHPEFSFVSCRAEVINEEGKVVGLISHPSLPTVKEVYSKAQFVHPAAIFVKNALVACGGYYSDQITVSGRCEDYDLWCRLYCRGFIGGNFNDYPLYQYRETSVGYKKRTRKTRWYYFLEMKRSRKYFAPQKMSIKPLLKSFLVFLAPSRLVINMHKKKISRKIKRN